MTKNKVAKKNFLKIEHKYNKNQDKVCNAQRNLYKQSQ